MYDGQDPNNTPSEQTYIDSADNQQAAEAEVASDHANGEAVSAAELSDIPVDTSDPTGNPTEPVAADLPTAGGKLDATPTHAFNATNHPDWAQDANTIPEGQAPAPAGVATDGTESTIPASSEAPAHGTEALPGDDQPETPEEEIADFHEAFPAEVKNLRRAVVTLRSNSAANQPGTFVYSAITDIEAALGRLTASAVKGGFNEAELLN